MARRRYCWEIPFEGGTESGPEDVDPKKLEARRLAVDYGEERRTWPGSAHPGFGIVDDDRIATRNAYSSCHPPRVAPGD